MTTTHAGGFRQGQHICSLYETVEQQLAVAVGYIAEGLRQRERCLYVASSTAGLDEFRQRLRGLDLEPEAAEGEGALVLRTSERAHLHGGRFDSERMLGMLNDCVEEALNDGFAGLRTCGDMSWLLGEPDGAHQVVEYEAVLNQFFRNVRALGMCQYDYRRLPERLIDGAALENHSSVVLEDRHVGNPFFRASRHTIPGDGDVASKLDALRRLQT
jgi:hypothetical protein